MPFQKDGESKSKSPFLWGFAFFLEKYPKKYVECSFVFLQ
ncbi:hypothetical protein BAT_2423 [Bacillus pumilus ATCC 7061]|nr:hypothetical protein BAT_2423 [Bacillus pumilus ATCC 7061]